MTKRKSKLPVSYVKTMVAITVAGYVGAVLLQVAYADPEPGTVGIRKKCLQALERAQAASKLWGTVTDPAIMKALEQEILAFKQTYLGDQRMEIVQLTSVALMMLEDVQQHLTRQDRIDALERLMRTVQWIHNYHEAPVDIRDEEPFYRAADSVERWREVMG